MTAEDRIVDALLRTRKYGALDPSVLVRTAREGLRRHGTERHALQFARRKLHQVTGAFLDVASRKRVLRALGVAAAAEGDAWLSALQEALRAHASSAERGADPAQVWGAILEYTGPVRSVLDLGCGLHPLTLPWSGLPRDVRYEGWELDGEVCVAVERALVSRFPALRIRRADVLDAPEFPEADLVLLLKLAPTLEHQDPAAWPTVMDRLRARHVAMSWPRRSLGGRRRFGPPAIPGTQGRLVMLGDEVLYVLRLLS